MSDIYAVLVEGLDELGDFAKLSSEVKRAAQQAINKTADRTRTAAADLIYKQLNFPGGYLSPSTGRLTVSNRATQGKLQAEIVGRRRATSLARFLVSGTPGKVGVSVQVKRGQTARMDRAFVMKLKSGAGVETGGNLGLAVRTAKGKRPDKAYKPVKVSENLWLLYGPSVDQAFRYARENVKGDASSYLAKEFERLLEVQL